MDSNLVNVQADEQDYKKRLQGFVYKRHFKFIFSVIILINIFLISTFIFLRSDFYQHSRPVPANTSQNANEDNYFIEIKPSKLTLEKGRVLVTNDCDYEPAFACKLYAQNRDGGNTIDLIDTFDYSKGGAWGGSEGLKLEGNIGRYIVYTEDYYAKKSSDGYLINKDVLGFIDLKTGKKTTIENLTQTSKSKNENEVGEKGTIIQVIPIKERNSVVYSLSKEDGYCIKEYNFDTHETKIVVDSNDLQPEPNFYNNPPPPNKESDPSKQRVVYLLPPPVVIHQLGRDIIVLKLITGGIGKTKRIDLSTGKYFDYSFIPNKLNKIVSNGDKIAYTYLNSAGYEVLEVVEAKNNKRLIVYKRLAPDKTGVIKFGFMGNILLFQEVPGKIMAWNGNLYTTSYEPSYNPIEEQFDVESYNYRKYNNYLNNSFILSRNIYNGSITQNKHTIAKFIFDKINKTFKVDESEPFSVTAKESMLVDWQ